MLAGFTAGLLLITISELGDKTFFISAILAMRHPPRLVFLGATMALAAMTVISVLIGQVASFFPDIYVRWAEMLLFLGFGLKLLYDASQMSAAKPNLEEQEEAAETVLEAEARLAKRGRGRGNRAAAIVSQAFGLTFIAEWGDRTQFTTIALAAANHPFGVTLGAVLGHAVCAFIAVQCGKLVCGRLSERTITAIGGALFLVFATISSTKLLQ